MLLLQQPMVLITMHRVEAACVRHCLAAVRTFTSQCIACLSSSFPILGLVSCGSALRAWSQTRGICPISPLGLPNVDDK
jgi:hypothetical protein